MIKNTSKQIKNFINNYLLITQRKISINGLKIQFGCGLNHFLGWLNTDIPSAFSDYKIKPQAYIDITKTFPISSNTCSFLYNEHLIEHITQEQAKEFANECYRVLKNKGVVRIATPDLDHIIRKYNSNDWMEQDWLHWPEYKFIKTKGEMLNIVMRWWGHKFLYNYEDLSKVFYDAGFSKVSRNKLGKSKYKELMNKETRKDSLLIIEAIK